ncbi:Ig-like domain-containing protein [Bacteroidota bacterium]
MNYLSKIIKTSIFHLFMSLCMLVGVIDTNAQIPDPNLGLRADWMRGTYGLNWKPVRTDNGNSETEGLSIKPFLEQIQHLKTVDYIQVHLNESATYSTVHLGPHGLIESLWQGDMSNGNPINLAVPRASIGRDPLMDIMKDVKAAGLKVMVYANSGCMLTTTDAVADVSDRFKAWCDTDSIAQAFINSKSYHTKSGYPNRPYLFCYAEFIVKEYALRYGDLIDAWLWDTGRTIWSQGGDFDYDSDHGVRSDNIEEQRIYQAFADACRGGNPDAAIAFNNSPGDNDMVDNPFTPATYFDDYMFGHPYSGGKFVGDVAQNFFALEWLAERDGYIFTNDPENTWTWDDKVVGHWDPPMSTGAWNTGSTPGVADSIFAEYYGTAVLGNGAVSFGIPLVGRYNFDANGLICRDWGMKQLEMLDSLLLADQYKGAPVWARQETYLPPAYLGQAYSRTLVEGVDFWDPEGDEITDVLILSEDGPPSWLSISETEPGTWTLSGNPDEAAYAEYEFSIQVKEALRARNRSVKLEVYDPDAIAVTSVLVSPSVANLFLEETQSLSTIVFPSDASEKSVSWSSSDTTIATVNSTGLLSALDTGSVIITATTLDGAYTDECMLKVAARVPVSAVVVLPDSVFMTAYGEKTLLSGSVLPSDATNQSISWSSDNPSVAVVNESGEVTAIGTGSATISATSEDGGFTDGCIVNVTSEGASNLALGGVATQSSTDFSGVASRAIDGNTDGAYGNGSVTHTNAGTNPWWEVDLRTEYSIGTINIFGRTDDCCMSRLANFTVFVYDTNGTETHSETFTSYPDPSVSSNAEAATGQKVRIVLNGSTYALSLAEVQVFNASSVDSILVSPDSTALFIGDAQLLRATIYPEDATNKNISWSSSNTSVVSVHPTGIIQAQDTGIVTITATTEDGAYSDECIVTVLLPAIPVASVVVSPDSVFLYEGDSAALIATILPSDASNQGISWSSSDTMIVTVDSSGLAIALDTGRVSITATSSDGGFTDICVVSVMNDTTGTQNPVTETAQQDLRLFPNPANSTLNYDFQNIQGSSIVSVYSIFGKLMFNQEIENSSGQLNINGLSSGVYVIKIQGMENIVRKFVKD